MPKILPYTPNKRKLAALDPDESRKLFAALIDQWYGVVSDETQHPRDRKDASAEIRACHDRIREIDKHKGNTTIAEMKAVLGKLEAAQAKVAGGRAEQLDVPE